MTETTDLACACGHARLRVHGIPIMSVECVCESCRKADARLSSRLGFRPVADAKGATGYVMYRKDRVTCSSGADSLREHRLTPDSTTRRVVATCCQTPMFLEFMSGHWLSVYRSLWPEEMRPKVQMRTMTKDAPDITFSDDVPNAKTHTLGFIAKLLKAWIAMGFRVPKIGYVSGSLSD